MSDFAHVFETPPPGAAADWTIPQGWDAYTDVEHKTWVTLYERQMKLMPRRACKEFLFGLDRLNLHRGGVPDFGEISEQLRGLTRDTPGFQAFQRRLKALPPSPRQ